MKDKLLFEILNTLADDGENIEQIEHLLSYFNIEFSRKKVKKCLNELLDKSLIYITYPNGSSNDYFIKLSYDNKEIEDYWFEMTEKGRKLWERIEFKSE
ncbi:hypothetical protein [Caloranaerobacter sp. DY30410]|uniref:hypothetical protein n=1 Tax=Caloranaerobacter sp. DY30410 TaxID=3238305 RepID=UPI003D060A9A